MIIKIKRNEIRDFINTIVIYYSLQSIDSKSRVNKKASNFNYGMTAIDFDPTYIQNKRQYLTVKRPLTVSDVKKESRRANAEEYESNNKNREDNNSRKFSKSTLSNYRSERKTKDYNKHS